MINQADINQLLRFAIQKNTTALVISHNHPQGQPQPSPADLQLTQRIQQACQLVDIRLIDHCIIAPKGSFSFAEHQLIKSTF